MEGEVTVICVDTSLTNICWFRDQIRAVEIYCQLKLKAHLHNLVGIVTSSQPDSDYPSSLYPTNSLASVSYTLHHFEPHEQEYSVLQELSRLSCLGWFDQEAMIERKKRIVVFCGSPLLSNTGQLPEDIAQLLKTIPAVIDVVDFGTRVEDEEDCKTKYLKALVDAMNHNNDENESRSRYFLFEDDGFSLSRRILSSSIVLPLLAEEEEEAPIYRTRMEANIHNGWLSMEGEVTMICVDTSITSLSRFRDQIHAAEIYCERKLKAHPDNNVSIARFGQLDLGISLDPTNCLGEATSKLAVLNPFEQEYTDLLQGFELHGWLGHEDMKKRIVVFCGSPLLSTTGQTPQDIAHFLKKRRVVLDVVDFDTRVMDEEDCRAKYFKALVDAMNDNNKENEDSRYLLIEDDGFSLSHHISSSSIVPPLVAEETEVPISFTRMEENIQVDVDDYEEAVGWD